MPGSAILFDKDGPIGRRMDLYEVRPQQVRMAEAVEAAITSSGRLLVEAGTGVGKSLAYLVPFVNWAVAGSKRVVISTYTKALQTQLYVKDLPFLESALGLPFRYALCMGSDNYACLRKSRRVALKKHAVSGKKRSDKQAEKILGWLDVTGTGLRTDLDFEPDAAVWGLFSRESDLCLGRKCPYAAGCFYLKARKDQANAHILITNHSLLFTDMMSGAKLLPEYHGLVLDEAHTLEDVATAHFGRTFNNIMAKHILDSAAAALKFAREDLKVNQDVKDMAEEVRREASVFHSSVDRLFAGAETFFGTEERLLELADGAFEPEDISASVAAFSLALQTIARTLPDAEEREEFRSLAARCDDLAEAIDFILYQEKAPDYVYWAEIKPLRGGMVLYAFHAAPVDISSQLAEKLFEGFDAPIVLTSATLASPAERGKADMGFIKRRLGVGKCEELILDSPFDYANNVIIYTPGGVPDPNEAPDAYKEEVKRKIIDMYDILGGRIFALFTSYEMLNSVSSVISDERPGLEMLKQGDLPRYVLLDVFKKSGTSVLMGTSTFWQGVDVPGSSLECVIITRLPFSVPADPINAARIKYIENNGGNAFLEYQLPQAIIMFKQGFGRLIRTASDRGVVAVLDPRIRTRRYGKAFIDALPRCRRTDRIEDVREFFGSGGGELRVEYDEGQGAEE